jgi:hypothetical protein
MKKWLRQLYRNLPVIRELQSLQALSRSEWDHKRRHDHLLETAAVIQALEALKAGNERYRDPKRLLVHGAQYWSQNYEDGMIAEIYRRIGTKNKQFLEIGVGDGTENNTTCLLSDGWKGWWLEADPKNCDSIRARLRESPYLSGQLKLEEAFVSPGNIGSLLAKLGVPPEIDLFSLDIDLNTYHVWAALTDFRPRVVVVEYNAGFPPSQHWIHPLRSGATWDLSQSFGASLKAYEALGSKFGYALVGCDITGINAFFVRHDLLGNDFCAPFTSENHYEPPRYHLWFRFGHPAKLFVESHEAGHSSP